MPTISVVIPSHNRLPGLQKSLESLWNQEIIPDEVIVIDDGSQLPLTKDIFLKAPDNIKKKLLRNDTASGANHARNRGILASKCDYIAFLDDDDMFKPEKIKMLKETIQKKPSADVIYHPAHIHMPNEGITYISKPKDITNNSQEALHLLLIGNPIGGTPMVTVRKQALIDSGLFDETLPAMQDRDMWLRLAEKKYNFLLIPYPLTDYFHITNSNSITKNIDNYIAAAEAFSKKFKNHYQCFDKSDLKKIKASNYKELSHRYLLNNNLAKSLKYQMKNFLLAPSLKNAGFLACLLLGKKFTLIIRSKL